MQGIGKTPSTIHLPVNAKPGSSQRIIPFSCSVYQQSSHGLFAARWPHSAHLHTGELACSRGRLNVAPPCESTYRCISRMRRSPQSIDLRLPDDGGLTADHAESQHRSVGYLKGSWLQLMRTQVSSPRCQVV
jgi:hypothetical protein